MAANTIEEVIEGLEQIIDECIQEKSRIGYFAALYHLVTVTIRDKIKEGDYFDDNERMERLDVIFANRYLEGYRDYKEGKVVSACWKLAFDTCRSGAYVILQQLLVAMNAHINFDLGIACAEVAPGDQVQGLYDDFLRINVLLASLVATVQGDLDTLSPWIGWVDRRSRGFDTAIINWSVKKARNFAWELALELAGASSDQKIQIMQVRDEKTTALGKKVLFPGFFMIVLLFFIRQREVKDPAKVIEVLADKQISTGKIQKITRKFAEETGRLKGK